ncbi:hypothetical protein BD324DRAFT_622294 [Kockovaella imperatae]|uniref:Hydroxyneurosporene synthase n=1 Tax=Kockovaella imperatae TaxID=4999 RepID=A0A1Y1UHS0_9TREE|nr:hypothetical protein BD324DRAFT_622294 [Kockovaella imperatae]ORX37539.1 hypothetical protein BD324DRAFT_622294 [Kockovaella imperatae]
MATFSPKLFITTFLAILASRINGKIINVPPHPSEQPTKAEMTLRPDSLDAPKLDHVEDQFYEWWYFDVISDKDGQYTSLDVVFYTSTTTGFDILGPSVPLANPSVDLIQVTVGFANGSVYNAYLNGSQATFIMHGDGVTGIYPSPRAMFNTASDLSSASVVLNAPEVGFEGVLHLTSTAPPHGPCDAAHPGISLELMPHVGWVNAFPDAIARASITVNGEQLVIEGRGYHDKNWGDRAFSKSLDTWYWGHATLGDYSIVFFDTLDYAGVGRSSSYVAKDGKILVSQCKGVVARPFGNGATYPPRMMDPEPLGLHLTIDTPDGHINATLTKVHTVLGLGLGPYHRWLDKIAGTVGGGEELYGLASFEQFAFSS